MNISRSQLESIAKIYNLSQKEIRHNEKKSNISKKDEVLLSPEYIELSKTIKLSTESDDKIRNQKIADLKNRIQSGTYSVDSKLVAEKLLQEIIDKRI